MQPIVIWQLVLNLHSPRGRRMILQGVTENIRHSSLIIRILMGLKKTVKFIESPITTGIGKWTRKMGTMIIY